MGTILDKIVETKRSELALAKLSQPIDQLRRAVKAVEPPRDFRRAIMSGGADEIQLVAEIKKSSPSAGLIVKNFDPELIAKTYDQHGAAAISVLTDETYFDGHLSYIAQVKSVVPLPVLRKDFIIDEYQVYEARVGGADAVLLIVAILTASQIQQLAGLAAELGMTSLIEVHNAAELEVVLRLYGQLELGTIVLGINNRDLKVQRTDLSTTGHLAGMVPGSLPFVSESGIANRDDVLTVQQAGARAMLVGESILRSPDIGRQIDLLLGK